MKLIIKKFETFNPYELFSLYKFDHEEIDDCFKVYSWLEKDIIYNANYSYKLIQEICEKVHNKLLPNVENWEIEFTDTLEIPEQITYIEINE